MNFNDIFKAATVILIIILIFVKSCSDGRIMDLENRLDSLKNKPTVINTKPKEDGEVAPKVETDTFKVPYIVYRDTGTTEIVYDTIMEPVDSLAILRDWYTIRFYKDSIKQDGVIVIAKDTLQKNKIIGRQYSIQNTINENTFKTRKVLIGGNIGSNGLNMLIGPELTYMNKQDNAFRASYLFNPGSPNYIMFGYSTKISFKTK